MKPTKMKFYFSHISELDDWLTSKPKFINLRYRWLAVLVVHILNIVTPHKCYMDDATYSKNRTGLRLLKKHWPWRKKGWNYCYPRSKIKAKYDNYIKHKKNLRDLYSGEYYETK